MRPRQRGGPRPPARRERLPSASRLAHLKPASRTTSSKRSRRASKRPTSRCRCAAARGGTSSAPARASTTRSLPGAGASATTPPRRRSTRRPPSRASRSILDENVEAEGHDFFSVGVLDVSPDDRWVAVGTDFDGDGALPRHRAAPRRPGRRSTTHSRTCTTASRGPPTAGTSSTRASTTRCARGSCGATSWARAPTPTCWSYQEDDAQFNPSASGAAATTRSSSWRRVLDDHRAALPRRRRPDRGADPARAAPPGRRVLLEHYIDARGDALVAQDHQRGRHRLPPARAPRGRGRVARGPRPSDAAIDSTASTPSRGSSRSASVTTRAPRCASSTCSTATTPSATTCSNARAWSTPASARRRWVCRPTSNFATTHLRIAMTSMVTPPLVADVVVATGEWIVRKRRTVYDYDRVAVRDRAPVGRRQRRRAHPGVGRGASRPGHDRRRRRTEPDRVRRRCS